MNLTKFRIHMNEVGLLHSTDHINTGQEEQPVFTYQ